LTRPGMASCSDRPAPAADVAVSGAAVLEHSARALAQTPQGGCRRLELRRPAQLLRWSSAGERGPRPRRQIAPAARAVIDVRPGRGRVGPRATVRAAHVGHRQLLVRAGRRGADPKAGRRDQGCPERACDSERLARSSKHHPWSQSAAFASSVTELGAITSSSTRVSGSPRRSRSAISRCRSVNGIPDPPCHDFVPTGNLAARVAKPPSTDWRFRALNGDPPFGRGLHPRVV
jgi:hypothetical protein